eukprot:EG_transcript_5385
MAGWMSCLSALFWESPLLEVGVGAVQNEVNHRRAEAMARELHADAKGCSMHVFREQYDQAERHQDATIQLAVEQHAQNLHQQQLLYDKQRDYEERLAAREARRDMWDQKTEQTSTLLLLNTLMFSCLFNIMTQGFPPDGTDEVWLWAFSITMAISFGALFVSILYALSLQLAMSQYRIDNPAKLYMCGTRHLMFYTFWKCHCSNFSRAAYIAFSIGTCTLAANACIVVHLRFAVQFHSMVSTIVFQCLALGLAPFLFISQRRHFLKLLQGAVAHDMADVAPVATNSLGLFRGLNLDRSADPNPTRPYPTVTVTQPELDHLHLHLVPTPPARVFSVDLEVPDADSTAGHVRPPARWEEPAPAITSPRRPPPNPVPDGSRSPLQANSSGGVTPVLRSSAPPSGRLPMPRGGSRATVTAVATGPVAVAATSAAAFPPRQTSGVVEGEVMGNGELDPPRGRRSPAALLEVERDLNGSLSLSLPFIQRQISVGSSSDSGQEVGVPDLMQALGLEVEPPPAPRLPRLSLRGYPPPPAPPDPPSAPRHTDQPLRPPPQSLRPLPHAPPHRDSFFGT